MTYRKKLIEVALPLDEINAQSSREKSIRHGHPSTLHLWWARRPLAACRAVLFASLVDDPAEPDAPLELLQRMDELPVPEPLPVGWDGMPEDERRRQRLFDFIRKLVKWENSSDEHVLATARRLILAATDGNPPPVLDPFCGGGSIPLEAQRLGLEAHGSDLNPVAVMITKALIELPPKFAGEPPVNPESRKTADLSSWRGAQGLAEDVRHYGAWMRERAKERLGHLYPTVKDPGAAGFQPAGETGSEAARMASAPGEAPPELTVIAWLWARTVSCPNPARGATMPLVRSFWLSKKPNKRAWAEPVVVGGDASRDGRPGVRFVVKDGQTGGGPSIEGTVNRKGGTCVVCDSAVPFTHIRSEGKAGRMGQQLMAVVAEGQRGRKYLEATEEHVAASEKARPEWRPENELPHNPRDFKTPNYGMTTFADLFTPRQLVALGTFSELVGEAREKVYRDAVASLAGRMPAAPGTAPGGALGTVSGAVPGGEGTALAGEDVKGWHSRGYLPHFDGGEVPQFVTFRLAGSFPKDLLDSWREELAGLPEGESERRRRIEEYLDLGRGESWLEDERVAKLVEEALLHFDGERYRLHGWVVMPNHVHALFSPLRGRSVSGIVHS